MASFDVNFRRMISPITRAEIFATSKLADHYISRMQTPYYPPTTDDSETQLEVDEIEIFGDAEDNDLDQYSWDEEGSLMKDLKDHAQPIGDEGSLTNDFAVLGYSRRNLGDYQMNRSQALIRFFEIMHIKQLYLMDELRYDWLRFPYSNSQKRATIQSVVNTTSYREAFKIDVADLATILPIFSHSSRHSIPIIILVSTDDHVPIAMFLCDDGNFHTSFHESDREKIFYAASAVGLLMGGLEVCSQTQ